jgi:hypothetical protein
LFPRGLSALRAVGRAIPSCPVGVRGAKRATPQPEPKDGVRNAELVVTNANKEASTKTERGKGILVYTST